MTSYFDKFKINTIKSKRHINKSDFKPDSILGILEDQFTYHGQPKLIDLD